MKPTQPPRAITVIELLVVLCALAVLFSLSIPKVGTGLVRSPMTQALSNAKQIHLATYSMANDGLATGDKSIGWPGDLVASGSMPCRVTDFVKLLVHNNYLRPGDLKLFAAEGITPFHGPDATNFRATPGPDNNCAFTVYCVQASDTSSAIFLSTINATMNISSATFAVNSNADPFGDKGYVIFHKGGDGAIYRKQQTDKPIPQGVPCKMALAGTAALRAE